MQFGSWQTEIEVEPRRLVRALHDETRQAGLLKLLPAPAAKRESMLAAFGMQQELGGGEKSGWLQIYEYGLYGENQCYVVYQEAAHRLDSDISQGFTPSAQNVRSFGLAILAALIRLREKGQRQHGNLKPANVFFAGDYGNVLLTDPAPLDSSGGGAYRSDMQGLGILIYQVVRSRSAAPRFMQSLPDDQPLWPSTAAEKRDARWRSFVEDLMAGKYDEQSIETVAREFGRLSGNSGRPLALASVCVALVGIGAGAYFFLPGVRQYFNDRKVRVEANEKAARESAEKQAADKKAIAEQAAKDREKQERQTAEQQKENRDKVLAQATKDYEDGNDDGVLALSANYPGDSEFLDLATKARARKLAAEQNVKTAQAEQDREKQVRADEDGAIRTFTNGLYANYDFIDHWGPFTNRPDFEDIWRAALVERDLWLELSKKLVGSPKDVIDYLNDPTNGNLRTKQPFKDLLQKAGDKVKEEQALQVALASKKQQKEDEERRKADEMAKEKETSRDLQEASDFLKEGDYANVRNRASKYPNHSHFQEIAANADKESKKLAEAEERLKSGVDDSFKPYLDELSEYRSKKDWKEFFTDADARWGQHKTKLESDADFKKARDFFEQGNYPDAIRLCESRSSEHNFSDLLTAVETETNALYSANQDLGKVANPEDLRKLESRDTYSNYITNGKPGWADLLRRLKLVEPAVQMASTNSDAAIAYLTKEVDAENRDKPPFKTLLAHATSEVDFQLATTSFQKGDYINALNSCSKHVPEGRFVTLENQVKAEQKDLKTANQNLNDKADNFPDYLAGLPPKYRQDGKAPWIEFYKKADPVCDEIKQRAKLKDQIGEIDNKVAKIEKNLEKKGAFGVAGVNKLVGALEDCRGQYQSLGPLSAEKKKRLDSLIQRIQKHDDDYQPPPL